MRLSAEVAEQVKDAQENLRRLKELLRALGKDSVSRECLFSDCQNSLQRNSALQPKRRRRRDRGWRTSQSAGVGASRSEQSHRPSHERPQTSD